MEKIVRQEIPAAVVDNPLARLDAGDRRRRRSRPSRTPSRPRRHARAAARRARPTSATAAGSRSSPAERQVDAHTPDNPTLIDRRFNVNREIPEPQVRALLEAVLDSPASRRGRARSIEERLGRKLEPFDIWYAGFKPRGRYSEAELDAITRKRYPDAAAYAADIPRLLARARLLRRSGPASSPSASWSTRRAAPATPSARARRDDQAHLRTRVGRDGMDYKGYNIAVHEMGHNVEQVFSLTTIDHTLLQGVPNTAFTEALAFVFQARDLELLGLAGPDPQAETPARARRFLGDARDRRRRARRHGRLALAVRAPGRDARASSARRWSRSRRTSGTATTPRCSAATTWPCSPIYSHMIDAGLYLPDYPLGHLIAFQVEEHFRSAAAPMGAEFERMCQLGSITPDAWMRKAVGAPLSAEPLLAATERGLQALAAPR